MQVKVPVKFPEYESIPAGTPHTIHGPERVALENEWRRHHKGHDVVRPYQKYSTSKWECSYIDLYEILLDYLKHEKVTVLELGVYRGESLRYFREFFTNPDTVIVGIDTDNNTEIAPGELHNVFFEQSDQRDSAKMSAIAKKHGPFDVIIDDASHDPGITEVCFRNLWKDMKEGALYLVEDIDEALLKHLIDEVTLTHQGKGICGRMRGFGPHAGAGGAVVIKKTKNLMVGLEI